MCIRDRGVLLGVLALAEQADEGDLRPQHHAGGVADVIEVLGVLVVGLSLIHI